MLTTSALLPSSFVSERSESFGVHSQVYTDPDIFSLEMRRIFGGTWVYVGHESEIREPGSYKTAYMGLQPIIVSRDESHAIHVLLNRCRHRGAVLCREQRGSGGQFRCLYHAWVYSASGDLIGVAQRNGYPADFPQDELGLFKVPRVSSYRGLIFASLNADVPTLEEHLGRTTRVIDSIMDAAPGDGIEVNSGSMNFSYDANWKLQCENTVDGYHGNYLHQSVWESNAHTRDPDTLRQRRSNIVSVRDQTLYRDLGDARGYPRGHGSLYRPMVPERYSGLRDESEVPAYFDSMDKRLGRERFLDVLSQHNLFVFPNLYIGSVNSGQIWIIQPIAVDRTEVYQYAYTFAGADARLNAERLRFHEQFFGPAGLGTPDDREAFVACQTGFQAQVEGVQWLNFSRGLERERQAPDGVTIGHSTDEAPQRAIYREWRRLMENSGGEGR